jgi:hypothetical protein
MNRAIEVVGTAFGRLVILAMLAAPIIIYIQKFGFTISSDHERWSEMGSAMSGIYGPMLAFLAFGVLILQAQMQSESNRHMNDQSHFQQANADTTFYLSKLESALARSDASGKTAAQHLEAAFAFVTLDDLRKDDIAAAVVIWDRSHPQLFAAWAAYQSIVAGLATVKEQPYLNSLSLVKQRAIVVLSYKTCAALDNYIWCKSKGRLSGPYLFSDLPLDESF